MRYVFAFGPVRAGKGFTYACLAVGPDGMVIGSGSTLRAAMEDLSGRGSLEGARCEPALAKEARRLGLQVSEVPLEFRALKAAFSVAFVHGFVVSKTPPEFIEALIDSAARFRAAASWKHLDEDSPIEFDFSGAWSGKLEGGVLGSSDMDFGLVLYFDKGAVERVPVLMAQGRLEEAMDMESLAVLLESEPRWVASAIEGHTGAAFVPMVMRRTRGGFRSPDAAELAALIAALDAVTKLATTGERSVRVESTVGRPVRVKAQVRGGRKSSWHEKGERVMLQVLEFANQRLPRNGLETVSKELFGTATSDLGLLVPWTLFERSVGGPPFGKLFLEARGESLSARSRTWLEAQLRSRLSVHEVLRVEPGVGMELMDAFTGVRIFVNERTATRMLVARDNILGRVVQLGGEALLDGLYPRALAPEQADEVVAALGGGVQTGASPRDLLPAAPELLSRWNEAVRREDVRRRSPMIFTNSDGEPLVVVEDHLTLRKGVRAEVVTRLAGLEGAYLDRDDAKGAELTFTRPGNALHPDWTRTVIGSAKVEETRAILSSNSEPRADRLRGLVEARLGDLIKWKKRKRSPLPRRLGGETVSMDMQHLVDVVPEEALARAQVNWLDTPLPALEGRTPRQAGGDPAWRLKVHQLLRHLENHSARTGQEQPVDLFRRELGLDVYGGTLRRVKRR